MGVVEVVALCLYAVLQLAGLCLIPFGLPGTWVQVAAALLLSLTTPLLRIGWVGVFAGIAVVGEVLETLSGVWGARRFGGSRHAAWGALLGGLAGLFVGLPVPIIGSIVTSFLGSFIGAIAGEMIARQAVAPDLRVGVGAVIGRAVAIGVKLGLAVAIAALSIPAIALGGRP